MKKRVFLLTLIALIVFMTLACVGSEEISRAATAGQDSAAATATSAAQEFHAQLTLTAAEAAAQGSAQSP